MPNGQEWDPVSEFKQNWPAAGFTDQQILTNLQDPQKFRSAFPHYTGVTDEEIKKNMAAYTKPSESQMVAQRPSQVAPIPGIPRSPMEMVGAGVGDEAQGNAQMAQQYVQSGPMEVGRGVRDIAQGNIARGAHRAIAGAGVTAIPAAATALPLAAMTAPVATGVGLAGGLAGQQIASRGAGALGANPDQAALAGDIGGLAGGAVSEYGLSAIQNKIPSLVRSLTGTTPERLAQLGEVEGKVADIHSVFLKAEEDAHAQASAAYPDIKKPVKIGPPVPKTEPFDPTAVLGAKQAQIPFRQAQEEYSQLALDARGVHRARVMGNATGFDEQAILQRKNALGDAMQAAAKEDGKLQEFLQANAKFKKYMDDFHNRGSAVEPLLQMKPDETARIVNHLTSPDKGARAIETLKSYGVDTKQIKDLLVEGGTPLKIDVNEAAKLRKLGSAYPQLRLNESIDQAKYNRMPSSAQARLPAWAMRKQANIPLLPDALTPTIPTRSIVSRLLQSQLAKKAVKP